MGHLNCVMYYHEFKLIKIIEMFLVYNLERQKYLKAIRNICNKQYMCNNTISSINSCWLTSKNVATSVTKTKKNNKNSSYFISVVKKNNNKTIFNFKQILSIRSNVFM